MRKLYLLCVLCLACLPAWAQNIPKNPNKKDKKGLKQGVWTVTFDKDWKKTTDKKSIAYYRVIQYSNGVPQGIVTDYYLSGKKQWEAKLLTDEPEDVPDGKATWYYEESENRVSQETYFEKGLRVGKETFYSPAGKILRVTPYEAGKTHGREVFYDEAGKIDSLAYYEEGQAWSWQTLFDKSVAVYEAKQYAKADTLFSDIYFLFAGNWGKDHKHCAPVLSYLWNSQKELHKDEEAERNLNEMLRVRDVQALPKDSLFRDWLYDAVMFYTNRAQYEKAEFPMNRLAQVQKDLTGETSVWYRNYRRSLGELYAKLGKYKESEAVFLDNIAIAKRAFPQEPKQWRDDLAKYASMLSTAQEFEKAEKIHLDIVKNYQSEGDTTEAFAQTLQEFADFYQRQDNNTASLPWAQALVELQKKRKGADSFEYSRAILELQQAYRELQQFDKAEPLVKERIRINQKLAGEFSYEHSSAWFDYGLLRNEESRYTEAIACYQKAIELLQKARITQNYENERLAEIYAYLGETYAQNKQIPEAEKALLQAIDIVNKLPKKEVFVVAQIYEKIGTAQARIANYTEAEDAYKEAIRITRVVYGDRHHNYIQAVANLTVLYTMNNQAQKSLQMLEEVIARLEKDGQKNSPTYFQILSAKALAHEKLNQDSATVATYESLLVHYKKEYSENSANYMQQVGKLIRSKIYAKRLKEAETDLEDLAKLMERNKIKTIDYLHHDYLLPLRSFLAHEKKDYLQVIEIAKEENAIGRFLGKPKKGLVSLAFGYFMHKQPKEATLAYKKYIDFVIADVKQTFPYLSDQQKVSFYQNEMQYHLDLYYYIALSEPFKWVYGETDSLKLKQNKEERLKLAYFKHAHNADIFNYQLITKGILFEASQKMKQSILGSQDSVLIQKFYAWQAKKEEMNKAFQEPDSRQKEEKKTKINQEIRDIEKLLAQKSSFFQERQQSKAHTWQDVQKKLKKGKALVEVLAISAGQKLHPEKESSAEMYLAFVITPETKDAPLCVKLGMGDSLERKYARNYQNCIKSKKQDKYSYNQYWRKLADTLKNVRKVYFSPDGVYHKVNVNTLQNPETGKFVLEEKEIQFISQARDFLLQQNLPANAPQEAVLFGAPSYNSLPADLAPQDVERTKRPAGEFSRALSQDSTQRFFAGGDIMELTGTEVEVNNIEKLFAENQQVSQKYLLNEATEGKLKAQRNPSVLHIATHGFFISEKALKESRQEESATQRSIFGNMDSNDLSNPLRRSGLLLAHCKEAFKPKDRIILSEDGILLAEEAQNLALDKTDLVVLSACETGLGEVRNGEGVYGLQRAFQTAGAKSVLMSLWTVSDQATEELMSEFYRQWFLLKDKRKAFREAQLALLKKYSEPYFWGAFVLIGD